ncbi:MAG: FAD-binding oxidoreductase [Actinomycetia bacterium]|nr:FAD-binding oxidoreductase [Actinomycetes bacterium]
MATAPEPALPAYDVVIVGGAVIGSSIAWFLSSNPGFDGSVLVVERDPTYEFTSTARTNSCMRQQFSNPLNIAISRFAAEFVGDFRSYLGGDPEVPEIFVHHFGYMYLAAREDFAETLRTNQAIQADLGAGTQIMSPAEIAAAYPFYNVDDIICASHNLVDEGYFDSGTMFAWLRRKARQNGVEYATDSVAGLDAASGRVESVTLDSGRQIRCGTLVNAAGPRAVEVARMAGLDLPVEPRKRYTFVFDAAESLDRDLPLTIDPSGVHVRSDGRAYMAGCTPDIDPAVDYDNFAMDGDIFEDKVWPALAHRIPAFERIRVTNQWAGHYAHNTLDHNVVVGAHPEIANFVFANGFSGHGMQQSPAIGRGVCELITHGSYQTLDLTPLGYQRIIDGEPFGESAII